MRRRILLLSVGMTTLVVLAFAVPLVVLLRSTTANESKDKARYLAESVAYYDTDPMYFLVPSLCLFLTVLAFTLLGDALRDILDPRGSGT